MKIMHDGGDGGFVLAASCVWEEPQSIHSFIHAWPYFNILISCSTSFILKIPHTITCTLVFGFEAQNASPHLPFLLWLVDDQQYF